MSYRLLRITNLYDEYINHFYFSNDHIKGLSYEDHYQYLVDHSLDVVSSHTKSLRNIGVDANEVITNAIPLQQTWLKEHSISGELSYMEVVLEQIRYYKPEVLWIDDSRLFNKEWINSVKSISSIKLVIGHICAPYNSSISDSFSSFDVMFTCIPCMKDDISKYGVETHLLYHAFDSSILEMIKDPNNKSAGIDLVFTGSLYTGAGFHQQRIEYIEEMLRQDIAIKLYGNIEKRSKVMLKKSMYYSINFLKSIKCQSIIQSVAGFKKYESFGDEKITYYSKKLIDSINSPVFGLDMYKVLENSKMCFNIHGDIAGKCAGNVRLFEATGVGTCLLTDTKENLSELFDTTNEIVTYSTKEECIDKIKWLKENPDEARKIGLAGQKRTLKDHTIENRTIIIDNIITNKLKV